MAIIDKQRASVGCRYHGALPVAAVLLFCSIGLFFSLQRPDLVNHLAFSRESLVSMRLHTLITYTVWPVSLEHLIRVAISLLLSTYFIGQYLTQRFIWFLTLGSAVFGALVFCLLIQPPAMLVGSVMITWGFAGTVVALGVRKWSQLGLIRRTYLFLIILFTLGLAVTFTSMAGVQLLVAAAAFVAVYLTDKAPNKTLQATAAPPRS
jgi:hypothetical protein